MLRTTVTLILALLCVVLAFAIGRNSGSQAVNERLRQPVAESGPRIARILTIPGAAERATRLVEIFGDLGPADLAEVDAAFERAMTYVDPVAVVLLAEWWTSFDPEAAFVASGKWPLNDPDLGLNAVMRGWARRDPLRARLAFEGMQSPTRRDAALRALAQGWSESGDDRGLAKFLENMDDGVARQQAMQVFVAAMVARDGIDATLGFAEAIPDDAANRFKLQMFRRVATAVTQVDPARGAAWAIAHADGPYGGSLLKKVATSWIRLDPAATMAWTRSLPESPQRDAAMREAYREWLMDERPVALDWFRSATQRPDLEPALELFASSIGREDPKEGLDWAARITDQKLRERATVNIGRAWLARDAENANLWLEAENLPESWKERIVAEAKKIRSRPARS